MDRVISDTETITEVVRTEMATQMRKWLGLIVLSFGVFILGGIWQASAWQSGMNYRVTELERRTLEQMAVYTEVAAMKSDIAWIKRQMGGGIE